LIELKDVPRMLSQTQRFINSIRGLKLSQVPTTVGQFISDLKKGPDYIASHYLNLQFGWVPFIQDLVFTSQMKAKLDKKLTWLKKKNGKSVKRSVVLDKSEFSEGIPRTTAPESAWMPVLHDSLYSVRNGGSYSNPVLKSYRHKIWFEAKYTMLIPELLGKPWKDGYNSLAHDLLGLSLDPAILYKVYPWSWLLDWFTSVGDVVQNVTRRARHHIVAEYGYVMCSEDFTYAAPAHMIVMSGTFSSLSRLNGTAPEKVLDGVSKTVYAFRQREVANPYGFGITFASLSGYQWSILAALGLTRLR